MRMASWAQPLLAALLAAALWLTTVAATGFHFSPDSMSYAALARGFLAGRPFTGTILWRTALPGRLQAIWPPLYPALIALLHALGVRLPVAEFLWSGLADVAAVVGVLLAVRAACGRIPWMALPLLGGTAWGLHVASFGWTEPLCLALLGVHYWLVARALRTPTAGGRLPEGLLFAQGLAAGVAYLDRYAAAAFLPTALALPLVLATGLPPGGRWRPALRGTLLTALGLAVPVVPWSLAAVLLTGHLGAPYLPLGASLPTMLHDTFATLRSAVGGTLHASTFPWRPLGNPRSVLVASLACGLLGLGVHALLRRGAIPPPGGWRPAGLFAALLATDALLYMAMLLYLRGHFFFDAIGLRLLTPALYAALLCALTVLAALPWAVTREALLLPVACVVLWHGAATAAAGWRHPQVAAPLQGPWCTPGPQGDCALFAWLSRHTTNADLIIGNAPFTIDFQLGRTTEEVAPYPYNPRPTAASLRAWRARWLAVHPGGQAYLVLDAVTGPIGARSAYGRLFVDLWHGGGLDLGGGLRAKPVVQGAAYRVFLLVPGGP